MEHQLPYGLRFSLIGRFFKKRLNQQLMEKELTGVQLTVLKELERLEDSGSSEIRQRDLENISHVTHPTMTEILKRLERKEFISCRRSSMDRRHKCISTTGKARELHQQLDEMDRAVLSELCLGLSREQLEQLEQITNVMLDNAFRAYGKGSEEESDKNTHKEPAGI